MQNMPRDEKWLLRHLDGLSRRVSSLETAPRAGHTSVSSGGVVVQDGGAVLIYSGTPTLGNLIVSIAGEEGADAYGNSYPQGMNVTSGEIDGTAITAATITAGTISAGSIGDSMIVNSDVQGGSITDTEITFDTSGGRLLVYASTTTTQTLTSSGTFTVPAGVTSLTAECWGAGGGGAGGGRAGGANSGGYGGGGGAYAKADTPVTPGDTYTVTVGSGGAGGSANSLGSSGGDSSFGSVCVARGGLAATLSHKGTGGSASASIGGVKFDGGSGGTASGSGGAGGGASAGSSSNGNDGQNVSGSSGGAGGAGVTGSSGSGGNGGNANAGGVDGHVWGGGGGGGGGGTNAGSGGTGARGQVRITYTSGQTLVASIAPEAGVDQYGNAYPQGVGGHVSPSNRQTGTETISFTSQTSFTKTITFPKPFATTPVVTTNINSGDGSAAHWDARAININTAGFTFFVYAPPGGSAQTWTNIPVQWMAVAT